MRKTRLLSILALLLMAATGAWAQTETLLTTITPTGKDTYGETTAGVVTVTLSNVRRYSGDYGWIWRESGSVTVEVLCCAPHNISYVVPGFMLASN